MLNAPAPPLPNPTQNHNACSDRSADKQAIRRLFAPPFFAAPKGRDPSAKPNGLGIREQKSAACRAAINLAARGYNAGATQQWNETALGMNSSGKTVWWSWTALVSGTVSIDLTGSDYAFPVAVFTGATLSRLEQVATSVGGVSFDAVQGRTYQIAVGDAAGLTGKIELKLQAPIVDAALKLLLRSSDGSNWQNVRTGLAHGQDVTFFVHPAPGAGGPYYRAIIFDRISTDGNLRNGSRDGLTLPRGH